MNISKLLLLLQRKCTNIFKAIFVYYQFESFIINPVELEKCVKKLKIWKKKEPVGSFLLKFNIPCHENVVIKLLAQRSISW